MRRGTMSDEALRREEDFWRRDRAARYMRDLRQETYGLGQTHWVYRAYDADGVCLYIGCTGWLSERRTTHRRESAWFASAVRWRLTGPMSKQAAYRLEADQIAELRPIHNRRIRRAA
jgi:hypothetical protein